MKMNCEYKEFKIRKPEDKDVDGFYKISNNKEAMKYYGTIGAFFKDLDEAQEQVDWCKEQFNENAGRWIIVEKSSDKYIGDIGFFDYSEEHKKAELGYRLIPEYWGKGIISYFVGELSKWSFQELGYNRIEALVDKRNDGSKRVLLKNQYTFEGTLREYEFEHGSFIDLEMYSLLRRDVE